MGANEHSGPKMWRMSSSNDDPNEYEELLPDVPLLTENSLPSSVSPLPVVDSDEEEEAKSVLDPQSQLFGVLSFSS